jgi:peptide/nickel transport system permease protein
MPMLFLRILSRKLVHLVPTVFGILIINFFLLRLAPGDAVDVFAAESGTLDETAIAQLRERFGLDAPLITQLFEYFGNLANFSLGISPRFNMPVSDLIFQRLPSTMLLMASALIMALVLGLILGSIMASFVGRLPDRIISIVSLLFYSIPSFWIGLMLIVLFSVHLNVLPSGGSSTVGADLHGTAFIADRIRYLILPVTSLALFYVAIYARLTRATMLEIKSQDFVRTARAKGLSPFKVMYSHVLRNALGPVTTVAGMHLGGLLGGSVVVETIYAWPGLGRLAFEAVMARDFNVLLGVLILSSMLVILANILVDMVQLWLDPRIRDT